MKKNRYILISIILLLVITNPKKEKHHDLIVSCWLNNNSNRKLTSAQKIAFRYKYSNYFIFSTYTWKMDQDLMCQSFGILGNTWDIGRKPE